MGSYRWERELLTLQEYSDSKQRIGTAIIQQLSGLAALPRRVLDVGCGDGTLLFLVLSKLERPDIFEVTLIDQDESLLNKAYEKLFQSGTHQVNIITSRVEDVNESFWWSRQFELVIVSHVLYYVNELELLLKKLYQVTSRDGALCLVVRTRLSDGTRIRQLFREYEKQNSPTRMLCAENVHATLRDFGWYYSTEDIKSEIRMPASETEVFLSVAGTQTLVDNVPDRVTRLMGHVKSELIPSSILLRLEALYRERTRGGEVCLSLQDELFWITKKGQVSG